MNKKNVLFIGHSYHQRTGSSLFLEEMLNSKYLVTRIYDDSWLDKKEAIDYSLIRLEDYYAIIIFQVANLLPDDFVAKLSGFNTIFFPMENYSDNWAIWRKYKKFKIISFSNYNYRKLRAWGFDVEYLQFFPKPDFVPFVEQRKKFTIFFWQRVNALTWNLVKDLFYKDQIDRVILHRCVDPFNDFVTPSPQDIRDYNIEITDWFEQKSDFRHKIAESDVFVAPRPLEGIGFSFLEAMAMGKAVIASNSPTMNEYIADNENGYLFDIHNVKPIDLVNIDKIRYACEEGIQGGYQEWNTQKTKIYEVIDRHWMANSILLGRQIRKGFVTVVLYRLRCITKNIMPAGLRLFYRKHLKAKNWY